VIALIMGVSGSGKTKVGKTLARELQWPFIDSDDLHPPSNVAKMAGGIPLTDEDRWPWLDRIVAEMQRLSAAGEHAVVACSALKQAYRDRLQAGGDVQVVYLKGDAAAIAPRLVHRSGHFMPASLLPSQFAALEEPQNAIVVDVSQPLEAKIATITRALRDRLPA
jgi:carbohydrate kinase (thermoresistant glucokinase family)